MRPTVRSPLRPKSRRIFCLAMVIVLTLAMIFCPHSLRRRLIHRHYGGSRCRLDRYHPFDHGKRGDCCWRNRRHERFDNTTGLPVINRAQDTTTLSTAGTTQYPNRAQQQSA